MKGALLGLLFLAALGPLHGASNTERGPVLSQDTLNELSAEGGRYVEEEVRRALMGMKQMKEVMERNQEKHGHLMKTLKHSSEKKKGAAQLAKELELKLGEAEQHCKESLKNSWEACRPCLEEVCKAYYTSTCRRGFSSFSNKVQQFFERMSSLTNQNALVNGSAEEVDVEVLGVEESFGRLLQRVGALYNRSTRVVTSMHQDARQAFRSVLSPETQGDSEEQSLAETQKESEDSGRFFQGIGLDAVLESLLDFSRGVLQEFSSVVTQRLEDIHQSFLEYESQKEENPTPRWPTARRRWLCAGLRRQTSECWQLSSQCAACQETLLEECPSVRELQLERSEMSQLLEAAGEQYEEVLQIVKRHAQDTISWLSNIASRFGWVAELTPLNSTGPPKAIFNISTVVPVPADGSDPLSAEGTQVEVSVLGSPLLTVSVPPELPVDDPAFVQYTAQEALGRFKQLLRQDEDDDDSALPAPAR